MIEEAGRLRIPFTTGILIGIGETRRERVESLLAIRRVHRAHGHIQEVIVQNFRARPRHRHGARRPSPTTATSPHAVALARLDPRRRGRRAGAAQPQHADDTALLSRPASTTSAASRR